MPTTAADITLVAPQYSGAIDAFVLLEQDGFEAYTGYLTKLGVVAYLQHLLFGSGTSNDDLENCGTGPYGDLRKQIYAYPSPAGLHYEIGISWGEIGHRVVEDVEYAEVVNIQNEREMSLKYPCQRILSWQWVADAYDLDGHELPRPSVGVSSSGDRLLLSAEVVGAMLVVYLVHRHVYTITVPAREDARENRLQSFVYAAWSGGNTYLEVELPDDADPGDCNNRRNGGGPIIPGNEPPESVPPEDEHIYRDYCTQEIIQ